MTLARVQLCFLAVALILGLTLMSCSRPYEHRSTASDRSAESNSPLSLGNSGARTILPTTVQADTYEITFSRSGFNSIVISRVSATFSDAISLPTGTWDMAVEAKKGGVVISDPTSQSITISQGNNPPIYIALKLKFVVGLGNGTLNVSWTWPAEAADSATWQLNKYSAGVIGTLTDSGASSGTATSVVISNKSYSAGDYWLSLKLKKGSFNQASINNLVKIYADQTSSASFLLTTAMLTVAPVAPNYVYIAQNNDTHLVLGWNSGDSSNTEYYIVTKYTGGVTPQVPVNVTGPSYDDPSYAVGDRYEIVAHNPCGNSAKISLTYPHFTSGSGTQAEPWLISSATELYMVRNAADGAYFRQSNSLNIDSGSFPTWTPIGTAAKPFKGNYDGGYYYGSTYQGSQSITGLNNSVGSGDFQGVFGYVLGATIKNLNISSAYISSACDRVGLLAGKAENSAITNVQTSGTVMGSVCVGGLVGEAISSSISNCSSSAGVSATGQSSGGLVGTASGGSIFQSYSTAAVNASSSAVAGGLVGKVATSTTISQCYSINGSANSTGMTAGGLVGSSSGTIQNCWSRTPVNAGASAGGGLVGEQLDGSVSTSWAAGTVAGSGTNGGLIASKTAGTVINSYWDKDATGQSTSIAGTGMSYADMVHQSSFAGFDFTGVWQLTSNWNAPYLRWQNGINIPQTFVVTNMANGATGGTAELDEHRYLYGTQFKVASIGSLVRTGYDFSGWNTMPDGSGTNYIISTFQYIYFDMTLYAQWTLSKAPGVSMTASTTFSVNSASKAADSSLATYWQSTIPVAPPEWLKATYSVSKTFTKVVLKWCDTANTNYKIQVSNDDSTWTDLTATLSTPYLLDPVTTFDLNTSGKYLRVLISGTDAASVSLYEMEVYGY